MKWVYSAFRIAKAFVELNQTLKEKGLLWPIAGHSIHTHVSQFDKSPYMEAMKNLFRTLSVVSFLPVNPVDREEYMLSRKRRRLITDDELKNGMYKLQNREGMILDSLSFDIVKDLALYAKKIFVDKSSRSKTEADCLQSMRQTIKLVKDAIKGYLNNEVVFSTKGFVDEVNCLDKVQELYDQLSSDRPLENDDFTAITTLLSNQLERATTREKVLEQKIAEAKKESLALHSGIEKKFLIERTKPLLNELKEIRAGRIKSDYFFLLGKRRRDGCARLIHLTLMSAMSFGRS